ncbi:MAG: hypothetical protein HUJ25_08855 [Crocinitomicaceae bacterium]|nr:hypothetical protein [Crocinitomicaceae bacterium]
MLIIASCSKESIEPNRSHNNAEDSFKESQLTDNQSSLLDELERDLITAEKNLDDSRGILDVEFPVNEWDFTGRHYVQSMEVANSINSDKQGIVDRQSLEGYFSIVNTEWLNNVSDPDFFRTQNNVDEFEMRILSRYSKIMSSVDNPTAIVVLSKVVEQFVIRNVEDEQRQQRLLMYMSLSRHSFAFFHSNGIVVNGSQIFNDDIGVSGINPDIVNDVIDCVQGYAEDWSSLEWYGWALFMTECWSAVIVDCYLEVTS